MSEDLTIRAVFYDDGERFGSGSEMISEIRALRSENERLKAALEPFAKMFDDDSERIFAGMGEEESKRHEGLRWLTVYDLRRAKACITESQPEEGEAQ